METVEKLKGHLQLSSVFFLIPYMYSWGPCVIRMDKGSENTKVAALQYAFRENHVDQFVADMSIRFGTSHGNIVSIIIADNAGLYTYMIFQQQAGGPCRGSTRPDGGSLH